MEFVEDRGGCWLKAGRDIAGMVQSLGQKPASQQVLKDARRDSFRLVHASLLWIGR